MNLKRILIALVRWLPILWKYFCGYISLKLFHKELLKKDIWLIQEKPGEARDNGYHLFKYIRTHHPEINAYFVILHTAKDYAKVFPYGNIIEYNSKDHMLYYLAAKYSISSQACGAFPYMMNKEMFALTSFFRSRKQKCVFLQHGIIKDYMSGDTLFHNAHIHDLFVTSTKQEQSFVTGVYGYPDGYVKKVGLCRFDALHNAKEKENIVLVMPTWRSWLDTGADTIKEKTDFLNSEYSRTYLSLLKNKELQETLEQKNYKLVFYPHYLAQKYIASFDECANDRVIIASKEKYDVQDLLIRSSVLITDFSSVFFDFAYMGKPIAFYQFDEEQFRKGHYQEGYFSYREDGFGKVLKKEDEIVKEIEAIIGRNCVMEEVFKKRREEFFDLVDNKNCERNFKAILSLEERDR